MACLWVFIASNQRISQSYLETMTGYSDKSIHKALDFLKNDGLVEHQYNGWALVTTVQLPLPASVEDEGRVEAIPGDTGNSDLNGQGRRNSVCSKKEEELIININNSSSDSLNLTGKGEEIPTPAEIVQVLRAAATLFGREIVGEPRDYADVDRLLGWIAQAFHRRGSDPGKISSPAGLVYWAFHQGKERKPEEKYMRDPERYLPESFLRASGQWIYEDDE